MDYLLKASTVLVLFYFYYSFFLKKETFFNHKRWFLLFGVIMALLFPLVVIPIHIEVEPLLLTETTFSLSENIPQSTQATIPEAKFEWLALISTLYYTGLIVFLIQFLFQFGSLIVLLIKNKKNRAGRYTYVIVNSKISPFSFFKWIVYNPESFTETELQLMLTHEKIHANQMHSLDILFTQLSCAVFWFNPIIWLYRREVKQNLEYIADFKTQESTQSKKTYQHLLLKTCVVNHNISLSNNFYNSLIKERIVMLKKARSNRKKQWRSLVILPLIAGLLMSMNTEDVYVELEMPITSNNNISNSENIIEVPNLKIIFNKNMTDKELEDIKKELLANNIIMTINQIKRNSKGEIKAIDISFETENGSTNYNVKDSDKIEPFYFSLSDDGSFGVGAQKEKEIIIVESIDNETSKNERSNKVFRKVDGEVLEIIEVVEDTTNVMSINERLKNLKKLSNDSIYISTKDSSESKHLSLVKRAFYLDDELPLKFTNQTIVIHEPGIKEQTVSRLYNDLGKPLYVINGKVIRPNNTNNIQPDEIDSITVLKGESAIKAYGEQGKNGVIIIKLKDANSSKAKKSSAKSGSSATNRTEVNNTTFIDDKNPSKNSFISYITKYTSDDMLDRHILDLKKSGITVKYNKLKRNKAGEITSLKISLTNEKGAESSATWKSNTGIPSIEFGETEGSLIVRTSDMNPY